MASNKGRSCFMIAEVDLVLLSCIIIMIAEVDFITAYVDLSIFMNLLIFEGFSSLVNGFRDGVVVYRGYKTISLDNIS